MLRIIVALVIGPLVVTPGALPGDAQSTVQDDESARPAVQDPEATEAGREVYLGRKVAKTMHWRGAEWLMRDSRADEEDSARMLALLDLEEGQTVCDLGCGNGYYSLPMARAVGAQGKLLAVDIQPEMLKLLDSRALDAKLDNIELILGTLSNPKLAPKSCDLILMVDVYHELSHPVTVLEHVRAALKPKGRLVLVEFRTEDPEVPIKKLHRMTKAQMLLEMSANGLRFVAENDELPMQHFVAFEADPDFPREATAGVAEGEAVARGLQRALSSGDVMSLRGFIGERVVIADGTLLTRDAWLSCFAEELEQLTVEGWRKRMSKCEYSVIPTPNDAWPGAKETDLSLRASLDGTARLWHLRRQETDQWFVIAESTESQ